MFSYIALIAFSLFSKNSLATPAFQEKDNFVPKPGYYELHTKLYHNGVHISSLSFCVPEGNQYQPPKDLSSYDLEMTCRETKMIRSKSHRVTEAICQMDGETKHIKTIEVIESPDVKTQKSFLDGKLFSEDRMIYKGPCLARKPEVKK